LPERVLDDSACTYAKIDTIHAKPILDAAPASVETCRQFAGLGYGTLVLDREAEP
jgi:hypothetical protein